MTTKIFNLNKYQITYPSNLDTEIFEDKWYYGIIFTIGDIRYELIHNYAMDTERLIISQRGKYVILPDHYLLSRDIPFKLSTFNCLPEGITAKEI